MTGRSGPIATILAILVLTLGTGLAEAALLQPYDGRLRDATERGDNQVYDIGGNRLGLVDMRQINDGDQIDRDLFSSFTSSGTILGIYAGSGIADVTNNAIPEFTDLTPYTVEFSTPRRNWNLNSAIWVLWQGTGALVFDQNGQRATIGGLVTRPGNPLIPVPLPAGVWLMLTGLGALVGLGRLRRRRGALVTS
ncbi:VPLPA-CTERM sorting domain-containing protein [uncultured Jannaschia sp.]|uniref:VPLPA-CTERM sorting domain-containing protein n=1 Tax=uncultured Jannaschia sp. TaxID=293347 RepID=UPI00260C31A4|nr:VPLPA-CTERM sorting domain-containing protein [uncultured Jannaschia sp.]